ncbi:MAG: ATP-binding cassette domain-containing protein, partial [Pelagibacteraceae bacterium]
MSVLLKLKNVNLKYETNKKPISVLKGINLTSKTDETISIVGESGSGKTSLIMLIAGLEKATSGNIFFKDQDISKLSE